jgi:hypothetical protein
MKGLVFFRLTSVGALLLCACTEPDDAPLFVDTEYQVRCIRCQPMALDDEPRRLNAVDGEQGLSLSCGANRSQGDRLLSFSAVSNEGSSGESFKLEIVQLNLDADEPGGDCLVSIQEGNNTYEGGCTDGDPSEDDPCQVLLEEDSGIVSGTLLCENISNRSSDTARHVVTPGSMDGPADITIHGCSGL